MKGVFLATLLQLLAYHAIGLPIVQHGAESYGQEATDDRKQPVRRKFHRIFHGSDTSEAKFPFMADVNDYCGGSIIGARWILTAAHCVIDDLREDEPSLTSNLYVVVGNTVKGAPEPYLRKIRVATINIHPGFHFDRTQSNYFDFDIALLQLEEELEWNKAVQPIGLPEPNTDWQYGQGTKVTVAGWGKTEKGVYLDTLQHLETEFTAKESCKDQYWAKWHIDITENMVCSDKLPIHGHTSFGDSGGPLFSLGFEGWVQYAIVSFGDANLTKLSSVDVRLDRFIGWAIDVMTDRNQTISVQHNLTSLVEDQWHEKSLNRYDNHRIQFSADGEGFINIDINLTFLAPTAQISIYQGGPGVYDGGIIIGKLDSSSKNNTEYSFRATKPNESLYLVAKAGDTNNFDRGAWGTFGNYTYRGRATLQ